MKSTLAAAVCLLLIGAVCISADELEDILAQLESNCSDKSSNCGLLSNLCRHPLYKVMMAIKCKDTCGYCGGMGYGDCKDTTNRCPYLKDQVCPNRYFAIKYCKFTCGLCY
ncbi:uncharacterized protein LOC141910234 [Tubulanus polymorphus]|uniref:uncharacterized protein LOC141910234 n=1 Tax=Tubulanus polymorphus TaxID=672921 RepID=UPI003DA56BBB